MLLIEQYKSALSNLQATYRGDAVDTLPVSRIVLWNNGRDTILGSDIAATAPPHVSATEPSVVVKGERLHQLDNLIRSYIVEPPAMAA